MTEANIKIMVHDSGSVFVSFTGEGEAYIVAEDFVEAIKGMHTDVFDGKDTFNWN